MKDQFRSDRRIAQVTAPVLILHGDRDQVVPISSGQMLFKLIQGPKQFVRIPGGGHENLGSFGISEAVRKFLDEKFD
jgi:pimeloyl-ACP methyl ester carboxylesterase